jgi:galactokinase
MDQYTSAYGGIVHINFLDPIECTPLPLLLTEFVLGDSLQPKDTQKTLKRIRYGQEQGLKELKKYLPFKHNFMIKFDEAQSFFPRITSEFRPYLKAVLQNRKITEQAKTEFQKKKPDLNRITELMNRHHEVLRDDLNISTPRIEKMIENARKAGALATKINGSGEGGCMFALCPGKQNEVAEAISNAGGKPYIINIGSGLDVSINGKSFEVNGQKQ